MSAQNFIGHRTKFICPSSLATRVWATLIITFETISGVSWITRGSMLVKMKGALVDPVLSSRRHKEHTQTYT
jgi:hypothetical protein